LRNAGGNGSGRKIRWPVIAAVSVAVVVIGVALWFLFFREGGVLDDSRDVPAFSFDVRDIRSQAVTVEPPRDELERTADGVRATLDRLYVDGWIDPEQWDGGEFPDVPSLFFGDAAARAGGDLEDLTLGSDAARVTFMDPTFGSMQVSFLIGEDGNPFAAWATTLFRARGELDDGGEIKAQHEGRYLLRPIEDEWLIVGYDVEGRIRPARSPQESPAEAMP